MHTADTQTAPPGSTTTKTRKSTFVYAMASTGSNLLDSFVGQMTDENVTTLLSGRPVVGEGLPFSEEPIEKSSTVGEAPPKQTTSEQTTGPKTSRELAIERMGRVLKSDRKALRQER
jgi:hypothetical protein